MYIEPKKVVTVDFELRDEDGNLIDGSRDGGEALTYIHGIGMMIPALEQELAGRKVGERIQCVIPPEKAYGLRDEELILVVDRADLEELEPLQIGMQVIRQDDDGEEDALTIVEFDDAEVTLDANHPMAGATLHFDVLVTGIREATDEELDHGHVHGPGGHHH